MAARFSLELTIPSATDLKNVNVWRGGALKPYAVVWVGGGSKWITGVGVATPIGSNSYSWAEKITIQLTSPMEGSTLQIDFFHECSLDDDTGNVWAGSAQLDLGRLKREIRVGDLPALRTEKVMLGSAEQGEVEIHIRIREVGCHVAYEWSDEGFLGGSYPMEYA